MADIQKKDFAKIIRLGEGLYGSVFCKISFVRGNLSITGVEGPLRNGNCRGSCGQIGMNYKTPEARATIKPALGWDSEKIARFFDLWDRWHLNDMTAGSPAQEAFLRGHKPDDVLAWLADLPETDRAPAWV